MRTRFLVGSVLALAPLVVLSAQQQPTFSIDPKTIEVQAVDATAAPERASVIAPRSRWQAPSQEAAQRPDAATLEQVLQRVGQYVASYGERAALIVAAEKYTQRVSAEDGTTLPPRQMLAEFAIVKVAGPVGWIGFRDIVEVNGEKLTDRQDRLVRLLSDTAGDVTEARRISNESARFNIGPISRNFNVPTTTMFFFHPANISRFSFKQKGIRKMDGVDAWVLDFKETRRPSMVMTRAGKDVPCEGTVWVSPVDGTVLRTLVSFRGFADERVGATVRDKGSQDTSAPGRQSPSPTTMPSAPPPTSSQAPTQAPSQTPGQSQSGGSSGGGGQSKASGSSAPALGSTSERAEPLGRGPTPQQLFAAGSQARKLESLATIEVTYKRHDRFGMWLPAKMSELYEGAIPRGTRPPFMGQATTTADYSDFKQFTTSATVK